MCDKFEPALHRKLASLRRLSCLRGEGGLVKSGEIFRPRLVDRREDFRSSLGDTSGEDGALSSPSGGTDAPLGFDRLRTLDCLEGYAGLLTARKTLDCARIKCTSKIQVER